MGSTTKPTASWHPISSITEAPDNRGPEGFKATARWLRSAFPDLHAVVHEIVAEDDLIVGRIILSGTHQGDYMGVPATGRTFSIQHMHMYRAVNGKLVEHWACRDDLGQLIQLGLAPTPSASWSSGLAAPRVADRLGVSSSCSTA